MRVESLSDFIEDNKDTLKNELKKVIKPDFDGLDNPWKYKSTVDAIIKNASRYAFPRQARVVAAAVEYISKKENKSLIISAKMGTGKTDMSAKIAMACMSKSIVNFIVCPPHLTEKWKDEIDKNYLNPNAYRVVMVTHFRDLVPYTKKNLRNDGVQYFFIVSRETSKLSYPIEEKFNKRKRLIKTMVEIEDSKNNKNRKKLIKDFEEVIACPNCDTDLVYVSDEDRKKGTFNKDLLNKRSIGSLPRKCMNPECKTVVRGIKRNNKIKFSDCFKGKKNKQRKGIEDRLSVAEYVKRQWKKGSIDMLIADEVHEYKGGNTGQGNSLAQLISVSKKVIGLTGTLLNGYSSSLFYILYRFNPTLMKERLGYEYGSVNSFIDDYGAFSTKFEVHTVNKEGKVTKRGKMIGSKKEIARVSPQLLSILLEMTIFLNLEEIKMPDGLGLPEYNEEIVLSNVDDELEDSYNDYIGKLSAKIINQEYEYLGNLANDSLCVLDMPFDTHIAQEEVTYIPNTTRDEHGLLNKEQDLIDNIADQLQRDRNVLVFAHFTGKGIGNQLKDILEDAFPNKVIEFLPSTVNAKSRQKWIENHPCDILVCNPELVKTGLDLLEFPAIFFYQLTYNIFTLSQASKRSWRIGQTEDVEVKFFAYKESAQHKALELIASKVNAANTIEGKLSTEDDLAALADEDDNIQLALAKAIINNDEISNDIELASIKDFGSNREYDPFELYYIDALEQHKQAKLEKCAIYNEGDTVYYNGIEAKVHDRDGEFYIYGNNCEFGGRLDDLVEFISFEKPQIDTSLIEDVQNIFDLPTCPTSSEDVTIDASIVEYEEITNTNTQEDVNKANKVEEFYEIHFKDEGVDKKFEVTFEPSTRRLVPGTKVKYKGEWKTVEYSYYSDALLIDNEKIHYGVVNHAIEDIKFTSTPTYTIVSSFYENYVQKDLSYEDSIYNTYSHYGVSRDVLEYAIKYDSDTKMLNDVVNAADEKSFIPVDEMYNHFGCAVFGLYRHGIIDDTYIDKVNKSKTLIDNECLLPLGKYYKKQYKVEFIKESQVVQITCLTSDQIVCTWDSEDITQKCIDANYNFSIMEKIMEKDIKAFNNAKTAEVKVTKTKTAKKAKKVKSTDTELNIFSFDGSDMKYYHNVTKKVNGKKVIEQVEVTNENVDDIFGNNDTVQLSLF